MLAPRPYTFRADCAHLRMTTEFVVASSFDPEWDSIDAAYCLDAPSLLPTGSLNPTSFGEFTRREFQGSAS